MNQVNVSIDNGGNLLLDAHPAPATSTYAPNAGEASAKPSLAEIKNGKVVFKQKPISFEKHSETLQEIVKFREMLGARDASLGVIPEEHKPVIAKLAHESDKTLSALSKHILQELLPVQDDEDGQHLPPPLTLAVVEAALKSVADRKNYGLDGMPGVKAPAAVCVWRWEAKPAHLDWLPRSSRDKAENRIAERLQAIFDLLPKDEQNSMLDPKCAGGKTADNHGNIASGVSAIDLTGDDMKSPQHPSKKKKDEENDSTSVPKVGRPKKIIDSEKTAKEKEKQEKKAAKAEREQKEKEAQNKSRSLMKNFFKTGSIPRTVPAKKPEFSAPASNDVSEFQKTFRPFVVKKDTTVAPINCFTKSHDIGPRLPLTYEGNVIVIDDLDETHVDLAGMSAEDRLRFALQNLPPLQPLTSWTRGTRASSSTAQSRTDSTVSVRDVLAQLNEAEVAGDIPRVRRILNILSDRDIVPAKIMIFADDARPGYFGTWTRTSPIIRPRTPFAKDVAVFDYGYDSGEEWEEEPSGDADDLIDDGEDEDGDPDDADSDLDSWLVDDDDGPETLAKARSASPAMTTLHAPAKRKMETEDTKLTKKRKVVVPLVPFSRGPSWEQTIGRSEYNMFNSYRIQFFNDTAFPIDPFTFVSQCGDPTRMDKKDKLTVPTLSDRVIIATPACQSDVTSSPHPTSTSVKRAVIAPRTVFPEIHLAQLLAKITSAQTSSLPILIDAIYQDLRDHKVKKNSIEAKVREVAEKCKIRKVWIVKEDLRLTVQ
ncbi:chromatin assembly factor 1 subunit A-domain-containing protein [Mycena belliarum]|uniref:Chromatin assembly factor 1 subunit A-domain-containing protein n=1 Tax=Mycena belliarum TaxID=1033014 RepID=A0AAD6XV62_9AGAR|nr:chromatin assembly factor 1 subunit A-domain-containing protein [Mycena belliae]